MSSKRTSSSSSSTNNNSNKGAPPNQESAPKASDDATFNYFHLPGGTSAFNSALPNYMSPFPALNAQPLLGIPSSSSASNTLPPLPNMPTYYPDASNDSGDDDKPGKKRRTNYRRPENAAKLNAAVNALIMQKQDPNAPKDIRSVSKIFNIPYNTLRDNYLRVTTGDVRSVKRPRKGDGNDGESSEFLDGHLDDFGYDYDDDDNDSDEKPVPKKNSSSNKKEK